VTYLCVPIFVNDFAQARRDIALAAEAGADMVELRVDRHGARFKAGFINILIGTCALPCIVTCRPESEGGRSSLPDSTRLGSLRSAVAAKAAYVDVELEVFRRARQDVPEGPLVLSFHDFKGRPDLLYNLIAEMNDARVGVNKIVWLARTIRDNLEAFEILKTRQKPTIAFCMGEAGLISRVLCKKFGAFLTFASLSPKDATAPGQLSIHDMKRLYRWDAIGPATKVYGVVGSPIMHSMSPAIHNASFEAVGHDGVYLPMLVNPGYESFKAFMESFLHFDGLDLSGLSITIPHKESALRYLKEKNAQVDPLAERIGAVNTIAITPSPSTLGEGGGEGTLHGLNTDYSAILDTIITALGITREQLADYRIAVIGAGGTGRTAVAALAHCGATVVIYNRTFERAEALAREFNGQTGQVVAARLEKLCDSCCQIYINTTSVGMHPNLGASPLGDRLPKFTPDSLVFDTIYNPIETSLLRQARDAGAKAVGGIEMFLRQAAGQFQAWTAAPAPLGVMRRVLIGRLSA
jgi:3-dehydroquinate dehydratase/shikimate dehydrogenase